MRDCCSRKSPGRITCGGRYTPVGSARQGVKLQTQIVSHLCYSDFEDILAAIDDMDVVVLTIENSRSGDEMLRALAASGYR
jgi:methionine synthase II (cobalamin-independent)